MTEIERLSGTITTPDEAVRALYRVFEDMWPSPNGLRDRDLCCSPFDGAYGRAGWVIAVNGSPPRGMLTVLTSVGNVMMRARGCHDLIEAYPSCYCGMQAFTPRGAGKASVGLPDSGLSSQPGKRSRVEGGRRTVQPRPRRWLVLAACVE